MKKKSCETCEWQFTDGPGRIWEERKNCLSIIREYLIAHGFDGLVNKDEDCGCEISVLVMCDNDFSCCTPGYKVIPPAGIGCENNFYICLNKDDKPWEEE